MQCFVYASGRKAGTYLWLDQRDAFDQLPKPLLDQLGELRYVLELDLSPDRQLPREDAGTVLSRLDEQGWYLQLPPATDEPTAGI